MPNEHILVEKEEGVTIITLNRPEVLNAMNFQLTYELHEAMMAANADDEIGCIVITGTGQRAFSAGGDIHEQREESRGNVAEFKKLHGPRNPEWSYDTSASPKPVIGMMNGLAHGGGSVLASSLDFRVGCEHCNFRFLAAAYGRINCTWTLPNQVGWPIAKELLFTGRVVEAEEAYRIGLINHLVPCQELRPKTMELATSIAKNRPETVRGIKQLLLQDLGQDLRQQWQNERTFTTEVVEGYAVEEAFPEFLARKGRP
ncbi:MAG: enoyl-CoA hydratase/isomerase family protein [Chloroflexi bacterium]|nr:enoyl-CoA hydratase/isomerase family protein [Chloroflexota bacterium]